MHFFVTGIGTGVGKTVCAAVLTESLKGEYWKPVQAGNLDCSDSMTVKELTSPETKIHPETYRLTLAASPHAAARHDGVKIELDSFVVPAAARPLVIEGAGGLLVPLNDRHFMIDLIARLDAPVILVSRSYLGSINHTLLSAAALKYRRLAVAGIVFIGPPADESERVIAAHTGFEVIGHIQEEECVCRETVQRSAVGFRESAGRLLDRYCRA